MSKIILFSLLLVGCSHTNNSDINEQIFIQTEKACSHICEKDNLIWTGIVRVKIDKLLCQCEDK